MVDLWGRVRLVPDRSARVGRPEGALPVVDDLLGVPGGAGTVQQRVRVGLAGDGRVGGQPMDALVGAGEAVVCGRDLVGEVGDELGGAGVAEGPV